MEKHLLVTVSEDKRALHGARFVGHLFRNKERLKITLFYTAPRAPHLWEGERSSESVALQRDQARVYEAKGRNAINAAKAEFHALGFKDDQLDFKLLVRKYSKVMDIIQEAQQGLYDAAVLGRRGLSWLEEAFEESVTKGLLEQGASIPLWICRKTDPDRRHVLVCLDGSDPAYRIVDHVGFILKEEPEHHVTLLTVAGKGMPEGKDPEMIQDRARKLLADSGWPDERVRSMILESGSVVKTIAKETEAGRYAAVATGRTGTGQGFLGKIFMGSVSWGLFRELGGGGAALWISR